MADGKAVSLVQFGLSARMRVWTALTRVVAPLGLVRIFRRIFQLLSCAFAGAASRAWAVLTSSSPPTGAGRCRCRGLCGGVAAAR